MVILRSLESSVNRQVKLESRQNLNEEWVFESCYKIISIPWLSGKKKKEKETTWDL